MRTLAVDPTAMLDSEEKKVTFINKNGEYMSELGLADLNEKKVVE